MPEMPPPSSTRPGRTRKGSLAPPRRRVARAAASLGRGGQELSPLTLADYYAWRTRLFHVQAGRVFELKRDGGVRFERMAALPARAVPFTEAEAEQLGQDVHDAASRIDAA